MIKLTRILMMGSLGISLMGAGCPAARIPDDPIYTNKGKYGVRVSYMRKESQHKNKTITLDQFRKIEFGMSCMRPETILGMKGALKILCANNKATCYWLKSEIKEAEALLDRAAQ